MVPPIFCINLRASTERRRRMLRRFEFAGLSGSVRLIEAQKRDPGRLPDDPVAASAEACLRSHLLALRTFLTDVDPEVPGVIVMEDDVLLHDRFIDRFDDTMANVPPGTPLVSLGYLVWHWSDIRWAGLDPARRDLATLHPAHVWGTQAYWVSRAWAVEALGRLDRPIGDLPSGVTSEAITRWSGGLIAYPPLVLEEAHDSTIGGDQRVAHHRVAQTGWSVADYTAGERFARDHTIALCMIVRDESAVIERCLDSVRHLVDTWVIVDTGSTDGTPELIERSLSDVPGTLHHSEWRDFGHNRSELMSLARGSADYLLLLDADHTLHEAAPLPPLDADVHAYRLRHTGAIEYSVSRLVRGDVAWHFDGRTHEHLACDDPFTHAPLDAWQIVHHADGSSRVTKFERDRNLLELTLAEHPDDARAVFYLAQTLESLGELDAARERYEQRSEMGGFEEEAWYAQWRAAALSTDADPEIALARLLVAWNRRPRRLEPVHDAVELCARHGWWTVAHALTSLAVDVERPDDLLFVHRSLYDGVLEADHARVSAVLGASPSRAAAPSTPALEELIPSVRFGLVALDPEPEWATFNPSIGSSGQDLAMVVRSANYDRRPDGTYVIEGGTSHVVRTRNYFVRFDQPDGHGDVTDGAATAEVDLGRVIDVRPIVDRSGRQVFDTDVQGLEDGRLVRWRDRWWMVAATRDADPHAMARMVLAELDASAENASAENLSAENLSAENEVTIIAAHSLPAPSPHVHEKNWSPFVSGDELRFVYSWGPLRVLRWDPVTTTTHVVAERSAGVERATWRGGSQGLQVPGGWLFVVHRVDAEGAGRRYRHRFVRLDHDTGVRASPEFTFTGSDIEFAAGLARRGDEIIVSFGVDDRLAAIAVIPEADVMGLLAPADGE